MINETIRTTVRDLFLGSWIQSYTVSGFALDIFFSGVNDKLISRAILSTDVFVLIGDDCNETIGYINESKYSDEFFSLTRKQALLSLYDLSGYEVVDVVLDTQESISLMFENGKCLVVIIDPEVGGDGRTPECWEILLEYEDTRDNSRLLGSFSNGYLCFKPLLK